MSASEPLVSVLINNYNYARFLREAIDSALNQTYRNTEVIVVDDGSTDDSSEIIASYGDRIIPVLKENGGQASAFNAGFAASHGEWICLLDSDDVWFPTKVEKVVKATRSWPEAALIYHRVQPASADLRPTRKVFPAGVFRGDISARVKSGGGWWAAAPTSALCLSRQSMLRIGTVPEEDLPICADGYLFCIAPFLGPVMGMRDCLAQYREHGSNYFNGAWNGDRQATVRKLKRRQQLIRRLMVCVNSRLRELNTGVVLDIQHHWGYQLQSHLLRTAGGASTLRLSWEALKIPGEPSAIARLRTAGGLLLHGWRTN